MLRFFFISAFFLSFNTLLFCQTTDLSIAIEAQDLNGNTISQISIYENFQYVVTILNSGNSVSNATISINFDTDLTILSFTSQNNNAGASDVSNINVNNNVLTGTIAIMPSASSVELQIVVTAPTTLGGIAANGTVTPPTDIQDNNTSNNQSVISIDVLDDVEIDFTVTHSQIQPTISTPISDWGETVTYQFTITNNSTITFPLDAFSGALELDSSIAYGAPFVEFVSLQCIDTTNGVVCPDISATEGSAGNVSSTLSVFSFSTPIEMPSNSSITFEVVYRYSIFNCSVNPEPISVLSYIEIVIPHANTSSNFSEQILTNLLQAEPCPLTDVCIETIQISPPDVNVDYGENITLETTVCNNGPNDAPMRFFLQNLTPFIEWEIVSMSCLSSTGDINCNAITLTDDDQLWVSSDYIMPVNATLTIQTVLFFVEPPDCTNNQNVVANIRSAINILDNQLIDSNYNNNTESDVVFLPDTEACPTADLQVTKTQISPELPIGSSSVDTAQWGPVSYEITVTNSGDAVAILELKDYMPNGSNSFTSGILTEVECISTTGTAVCFPIQHANIGLLLDGALENGEEDIFWQILPEDNWEMPANSSITFMTTIDWLPECSPNTIYSSNRVRVDFVNGITDSTPSNNVADVNTYFAPCIDLVVQTFPEFTQVNTNQNFNWIIDISNSITSSSAVDVVFENTIDAAFTITGDPTCSITSGIASCIPMFDITDNFISGIIATMEAGSTVRISIPVSAPSFGGAFNNIAEGIPSAANNEEVTPDTNISINSVQVIAPVLQKSFNPNTINEGDESELIFTVFNVASLSTQNNISFTDNLPEGLVLGGSPNWIEANGCTATFIGVLGDNFVGVENLMFPDSVESCTFSVTVSADSAADYLNNFENFSNNNNIDTSQTSATLTVFEDFSNVDIGLQKMVNPEETAFGQEVEFTITATNLGTTDATEIVIIDTLPTGYLFLSATASSGVFDASSLTWNLNSLFAGDSASITLVARVISSNNLLNIVRLIAVNETDRNPLNNETSAAVILNNCLKIPEGISPNNDGINDTLVIPCIEDYPDNTIKIFNRYGLQVYEGQNYNNTWRGEANRGIPNTSAKLPIGTYFYILQINSIDQPLAGYIYLNY